MSVTQATVTDFYTTKVPNESETQAKQDPPHGVGYLGEQNLWLFCKVLKQIQIIKTQTQTWLKNCVDQKKGGRDEREGKY